MTRSPRIRRGVAILLVALLVLSSASGIVAAQTGGGGTIVVDQGQTSSGISSVAGAIIVRGTVDGDISALAGDVVVERTGVVTGDVTGASGSLRIAGRVDGSVEYAAGNVVFEPTSEIGGNVNVGAGNVVFAGTVDGSVTAGADQIHLAPSAVIGGDFRYDGTLDQRPGATVRGSVIRDESISGPSPLGWGSTLTIPAWFDTVYGFFANLLIGALLLVIFPRFSERVADTGRDEPLRSGLWGLIGLVVTPVVLVLIALTIIGIPITLLGFLLYIVVAWVGLVYGEYTVGRYLLARADAGGRWVALILGLLLFSVLGLVPIVGGLAIFLVLLVGLGALGTAVRRVWRSRRGGPEGETPVEAPESTEPEGGAEGSGDTGSSASA